MGTLLEGRGRLYGGGKTRVNRHRLPARHDGVAIRFKVLFTDTLCLSPHAGHSPGPRCEKVPVNWEFVLFRSAKWVVGKRGVTRWLATYHGRGIRGANRNKTEIASRPDRHLAYSHGKLPAGTTRHNYDKGQV